MPGERFPSLALLSPLAEAAAEQALETTPTTTPTTGRRLQQGGAMTAAERFLPTSLLAPLAEALATPGLQTTPTTGRRLQQTEGAIQTAEELVGAPAVEGMLGRRLQQVRTLLAAGASACLPGLLLLPGASAAAVCPQHPALLPFGCTHS